MLLRGILLSQGMRPARAAVNMTQCRVHPPWPENVALRPSTATKVSGVQGRVRRRVVAQDQHADQEKEHPGVAPLDREIAGPQRFADAEGCRADRRGGGSAEAADGRDEQDLQAVDEAGAEADIAEIEAAMMPAAPRSGSRRPP